MKIRHLLSIVGLAIGFAVPVLAQGVPKRLVGPIATGDKVIAFERAQRVEEKETGVQSPL